MQELKEILPNRSTEWDSISKMSEDELVQMKIDSENNKPGNLEGYDCKKCLNRGFYYKMDKRVFKMGDEPRPYEVQVPCECMKVRASIRRMKRSGLEDLLKIYTFDNYEETEPWQQRIKNIAMEFPKAVEKLEHKGLFLGGGSGAGKTHLCTAVCREFLRQRKEVRYMLWVEQSRELKPFVNDERYSEMLAPLKNVEVLYIDDLFKPVKDNKGYIQPPTKGDMNLAVELIDHRYRHKDLITIISCEYHIPELEEIDSALGSRIYQMTKENACNIAKSKDRNYRLRDMEII